MSDVACVRASECLVDRGSPKPSHDSTLCGVGPVAVGLGDGSMHGSCIFDCGWSTLDTPYPQRPRYPPHRVSHTAPKSARHPSCRRRLEWTRRTGGRRDAARKTRQLNTRSAPMSRLSHFNLMLPPSSRPLGHSPFAKRLLKWKRLLPKRARSPFRRTRRSICGVHRLSSSAPPHTPHARSSAMNMAGNRWLTRATQWVRQCFAAWR